MSFIDRVKETATEAMSGGKRQARRAQLELKNRQVERTITKEYARIGRTLYPLLSGGQISTNNAEVAAAVKAIGELQAELNERRGEIERVMQPDEQPNAPEPLAELEQQAGS